MISAHSHTAIVTLLAAPFVLLLLAVTLGREELRTIAAWFLEPADG